MAGRDHVGFPAVRDERKPVPLNRKVALVGLHRRHDHPLRELQEPLVEAALEHDRLLDEVDDLGELAAGIAPAPHHVEPFDDLAAPLVGYRLDVRSAQLIGVGGSARDLDRTVREAVPERGLPQDRLGVEHRQHPAHRAREAHAACVPAHRLREGESADDPVDLLGQDLAQLATGHSDAEKAVAHLQLLHRDTVLLCEAGGSSLAQVLRRTLDPLVRRSLRQVVDQEADPPGPDEELRRRSADVCARQLGQLSLGLAAGRGRKLLTANLKQQRRHLPRPLRDTPRQRHGRACGRARCRPPAR